MMSEQLFKVLNEDGTPYHGGKGKWHLPHDGKPGKWMPPIVGPLVPCKTAYHLCRPQDLVEWLGPAIYEAECRGERRIHENNKVCVREARLLCQIDTWNQQTARLFACDCAEHTLHIFEKEYPEDNRPRNAIDIARKYAVGKATIEELDAAWAAARAAARVAAKWATREAAWAAARAAARVVAKWETAEWAARAAARAAWDAAWEAARAAAEWAAWAAARAAAGCASRAEHRWQTKRLLAYLKGTANVA